MLDKNLRQQISKNANPMIVYRNGQYQVVPLICGYIVKDGWGKTIYPANSIEDAIETVDELVRDAA